jgi:hypothetical protein
MTEDTGRPLLAADPGMTLVEATRGGLAGLWDFSSGFTFVADTARLDATEDTGCTLSAADPGVALVETTGGGLTGPRDFMSGF